MTIGEVELRWILAAVGVVTIALIYLWGMRAQLRERLRERRLRAAALNPENEPVLDAIEPRPEADAIEQPRGLGDFTDVPLDHPLADKMLVDVEITPIDRAAGQPSEDREYEDDGEPAVRIADAADTGEKLSAIILEKRPAEPPAPRPEPPREGRARTAEPTREGLRGEPAAAAPAEDKMTLLLTVLAPAGRLYKGPSLLLAAQELKLKLHKNGVFDYFPDGQTRKPLFSIGHLREPGTFNLETIGNLSTPGLLLFMQLPGPLAAAEAVETLSSVAKQLTQKLGGTLCDERRNRVTPQGLLKLKNDAIRFERRLQARTRP